MQKSRFSVIFRKNIKIEQFDCRSSRLMSTAKVSPTVATDAYKRQLRISFGSGTPPFSRRFRVKLT